MDRKCEVRDILEGHDVRGYRNAQATCQICESPRLADRQEIPISIRLLGQEGLEEPLKVGDTQKQAVEEAYAVVFQGFERQQNIPENSGIANPKS